MINYSRSVSGKTFDFDGFSIKEPTLKGRINFQFSAPSRKITGLDKMVQQWLYIFLTPQGSDVFEPERGTNFIAVLEAAANDRGYISNIVSSSVANTNEQMLALQAETPSLPPDETFVLSTLSSIVYGITSVEIRIRIINAEGAGRTLTVPSPFVNAPI